MQFGLNSSTALVVVSALMPTFMRFVVALLPERWRDDVAKRFTCRFFAIAAFWYLNMTWLVIAQDRTGLLEIMSYTLMAGFLVDFCISVLRRIMPRPRYIELTPNAKRFPVVTDYVAFEKNDFPRSHEIWEGVLRLTPMFRTHTDEGELVTRPRQFLPAEARQLEFKFDFESEAA